MTTELIRNELEAVIAQLKAAGVDRENLARALIGIGSAELTLTIGREPAIQAIYSLGDHMANTVFVAIPKT